MQSLTTDQLKQMMDSGEDFELINVLSAESHQKAHIPGSVNIPAQEINFEERVEQQAGGKDKKVVVYCASQDCDASPKAGHKLEKAGFENVYDYEGGVKSWQKEGNEIEGSLADQ